METKIRDELGREGSILKKLDNSPTLRLKAHWSPVTPFSTRTLQQQLEDQHETIPQAEQACKVQFEASVEVKLESEIELMGARVKCGKCGKTIGMAEAHWDGKQYLCKRCRRGK